MQRFPEFDVFTRRTARFVGGLVAVALVAVLASGAQSSAQQSVPIVDLPASTVKTSATVGGVLGIRETNGGRVLIDDAGRRQLWLYDTTLTKPHIVFDSAAGLTNSYGAIGLPLIRYLGDSSLMGDLTAGPTSLLVLDGKGQIARSLALPAPEAASFMQGMSGVDAHGRLLYVIQGRIRMPKVGTIGAMDVFVDSNPVMRADLDLRRVDTIGRVSKNKGEYERVDHMEAKKIIRTVLVNPLPAPDEWAITTDGSVAFVRGHDYHIDWIHPDGSTSSSAKLPFDWKRLTDEEKQKLIDSARTAHAEQNAFAARERNAPPPPPPMQNDDGTGTRTRSSGAGAGITHSAYDAAGNLWVPLDYEIVDAKDIADYYPAIREGAVMADADNHLWILPTTSAQSRHGELVYDVVNTKGELVERVRMPDGRSVAGFGNGGVVYLQSGSTKTGFYVERTRLKVPIPFAPS